jgi:hypothetical protein
MRDQHLQTIREACIKANPAFESKNTSMMLKGSFTGLINYRDPTKLTLTLARAMVVGKTAAS